MGDLSGRPPSLQLAINSLLEQSTFETTSGELSLDSGVDSILSQLKCVSLASVLATCLFQTRGTPAMNSGWIN